jgi:hypothetical protein
MAADGRRSILMNTKVFIAVLVFCLLVSVPMGIAESADPPEELFKEVAVSADARTKTVTDHQVMRSRRVGVEFDRLYGDKHPQGVDAIKLSLFDDITLAASKKRFERRSRDNYTWYGNIPEDSLSSVVIVVEDGIMSGNIHFRGRVFQIRYSSNQIYLIHEIDQSRFPEEHPPIPVVTKPESRNDMPSIFLPDNGSVIDVMVVYTPAARIAAGETAAMNALIQLGVDETNQSYANSLVTQRIRLVYKAEVAYTESGDFGTDLNRLTNVSDGYMDEVHSLRDTYGADLVSLWIEGTDTAE